MTKRELIEKINGIHGMVEDLKVNVKSALDEIKDIMDEFDELPDVDDIEDDEPVEQVGKEPDPRD